MTQLEAHSKKIYMKVMVLVVGIALLLSSVSALNFDNTKSIDKSLGKYGKITITNAFGLGGKIAEYTLEVNRDSIINAEAQGTAQLFSSGSLFDGKKIMDKKGKSVHVRESNIFILSRKNITDTIPEFDNSCANQNPLTCHPNQIGSHDVVREVEYWKPYNFETLSIGNYTWRIEGKKMNVNQEVDWILSSNGKDLNDWAWWNSSFLYKQALMINTTYTNIGNLSVLINVTYNAKMDTKFNDIRFVNASETGELGYWYYNDTVTASNMTQAWVFLRDFNLTAANNLTIYMYYGNTSTVLNNSNITKSALIGDGFGTLDLTNNWQTSTSSLYSVNSTGWLIAKGSNSFNNLLNSRTQIGDDVIEYRVVSVGAATTTNTMMEQNPVALTSKRSEAVYGQINAGNKNMIAEVNTNTVTSTNTYTPGIAFRATIQNPASGDATTSWRNDTNNFDLIFASATGTPADRDGYVGLSSFDNTGNNVYNSTFDWIFARRYYDFTKIIYNFGAELNNTLAESTTLLTPANNFQTVATTQIFTARVDATAGNVTNGTLYLYWPNNSLASRNFSSITGENNTWTFSFSTNGIIPNSSAYKWNVLGCAANSTTTLCNFAAANRSITFLQILELSQSYPNITTEAATENFGIIVNVSAALQPNFGSLVYTNTSYVGTLLSLGNNLYSFNRSLIIPDVSATMGREFYWNLTLNDGSVFNNSLANLTVSALSIDDCSAGTVRLFNFTLKDEDNENVLNNNTENLTTEVNILINSLNTPYATITTSPFINFNQTFQNKSQILICLASSLGSASFRMDSQVKYGGTRYSTEYNNLQNFTLRNSTLSQNISLLDLLTSRATPAPFKITFKDQNFLPVSGALVTVTRKYVGQGVFKTVESPISDSQGTAIASLVQNEIIYTFIFTKDGEILGTFSNQQVKCSNPVINDCEISFSSAISGVNPEDFANYKNLTYAVTQNTAGNTFTLIFTTTDSATKNIQFNATKVDNYGNQSLCSSYLSSSTGTLTCTIPSTFSNVSVITQIYSNGELVGTRQYYYKPNTQDIWGLSGYLMMLILILTVPLMLSGSPIGLTIGVVLGLIIGVVMVLFNVSGVIGIGTSVMWAIVAAAIIIWKINNTGNG